MVAVGVPYPQIRKSLGNVEAAIHEAATVTGKYSASVLPMGREGFVHGKFPHGYPAGEIGGDGTVVG